MSIPNSSFKFLISKFVTSRFWIKCYTGFSPNHRQFPVCRPNSANISNTNNRSPLFTQSNSSLLIADNHLQTAKASLSGGDGEECQQNPISTDGVGSCETDSTPVLNKVDVADHFTSEIAKELTLDRAMANSDNENSAEVLRNQFELLDERQKNCILDCYNDLLPYPEMLDEVVTLVDDEVIELVFSQISVWQRLTLLELVQKRTKLYDSRDRSDKKRESNDDGMSPEEPALKKEEQPERGSRLPHLWTRHADMVYAYQNFGCQSLLHGHPLVIDCAFEYSMRGREITSYKTQIESLINQNNKHYDPYHIHLCNLPEEGYLTQVDQYTVTHTSKCYTDLFNKDDLIMLSPDAPLYMEQYDPSKIYIIGGIVDLSNATPLSYSKAQALGIQTFRLPIDIGKHWSGGASKRLTLTAVLDILTDLRKGKSWEDSILPNLPQRYHKVLDNPSRQLKERYLKNVVRYQQHFQELERNMHHKNNFRSRNEKNVPLITQLSGHQW